MRREHIAENERAIQKKVRFVRAWSALTGVVHLLAAMLLVWSSVPPGKSLNLLQAASNLPTVLAFISPWICAVLNGGMGLAYLSLFFRNGMATGKFVWVTTATIHGMLVAFLICLMVPGELPTSWLPQVLLGLVVAVVQLTVVNAGWWSTVRKWQTYGGDRGRWP